MVFLRVKEELKHQLFQRCDSKGLVEFDVLTTGKHQLIAEILVGGMVAFLNSNPDKQVHVPANARGNIRHVN